MQKKKTTETQVQQELSSEPTTFKSQVGWVQREPMTGAQAASLRRLAEEIREPHAFDADEYEPGHHAIAQLLYQDLLCGRGRPRQEGGQIRAELRPADDEGAGEYESQPGAERPA